MEQDICQLEFPDRRNDSALARNPFYDVVMTRGSLVIERHCKSVGCIDHDGHSSAATFSYPFENFRYSYRLAFALLREPPQFREPATGRVGPIRIVHRHQPRDRRTAVRDREGFAAPSPREQAGELRLGFESGDFGNRLQVDRSTEQFNQPPRPC